MNVGKDRIFLTAQPFLIFEVTQKHRYQFNLNFRLISSFQNYILTQKL